MVVVLLVGALRMVDDADDAETEAEKLRTSSTTSGWSCDDEEVRRCRNQANMIVIVATIVVNSSTSFEIPSKNCSDIDPCRRFLLGVEIVRLR